MGANRKIVARKFAIEESVLKKLSELSSTRGDLSDARKGSASSGVPLTQEERRWLDAAVWAIIRRVGARAAGTTLPQLRMNDLPKI